MCSAIRKVGKKNKAITPQNDQLAESNLISFFDEKNDFVLHFFEGQKLIHDLAIINNFKGNGLSYIRDCVLAFQPMIAFLKPGEGFGLYIDGERPFFRFKIETNVTGNMRTLLLPEDLSEIPEKITGVCRLTKLFTSGMKPYTSIIQLNDTPFKELSNLILNESYQISGKIIVSEKSDQSIFIIRLPAINYDQQELNERPSMESYCEKHKADFNKLFEKGICEEDKITNYFSKLGLTFLRSKPVKFKCACSRDRMLSGLANLIDKNELFEEGKKTLETKCDYCKTYYSFDREEILKRRLN